MNFQLQYLENLALRRSAANLNDVKYSICSYLHKKDKQPSQVFVFVFNIYLPLVTMYKGSSFQRRLI